MEKEYTLQGINIELTTCCPLHCPQCYCSLEGGRHIPIDTAVKAVREAARLGASHVELSGGETLCYPHLYELISEAKNNGMMPSISISGWHFDADILEKLILAGIDTIYVSLNGPTEQANALTRDGFDLSIAALEVLKDSGYSEKAINWVMHRNNADLLPDMISLAERYDVGTILIIEPMPTAAGKLETYPTLEQISRVCNLIKHSNGSVQLQVQHCFSPLKALLYDNKLWGNMNRGPYRGCTAGILSCAVDVNGRYIPCRHLVLPEKAESLEEYWTYSKNLNKIRNLKSDRRMLCSTCGFQPYCRPCPSFNMQEDGMLFLGKKECPVWRKKKDNGTGPVTVGPALQG